MNAELHNTPKGIRVKTKQLRQKDPCSVEKARTDGAWWPRGPHTGPPQGRQWRTLALEWPQGPIRPHHYLPALDCGRVTPAKWTDNGHLFERGPSTLHEHTGDAERQTMQKPRDLRRASTSGSASHTWSGMRLGATGCRT